MDGYFGVWAGARTAKNNTWHPAIEFGDGTHRIIPVKSNGEGFPERQQAVEYANDVITGTVLKYFMDDGEDENG